MIRALHDRDAIEAFTVVVRFASPVDDRIFAQAVEFVRKGVAEKLDLPGEAPVQEMAFRLPPIGQLASSLVSGTAFQRFSKTGVVEAELRLDRASIGLTLRQYPGWKTVQSQIIPLFSLLVAIHYRNGNGFDSVSMQYLNRFIFTAEEASLVDWTSAVLANSPWVATGFVNSARYWHSHTGIFELPSCGARRLININADSQDYLWHGRQVPSLQVLILAGDQFNVEGYAQPLLEDNDVSPFFGRVLEELHNRTKDLLRLVLSSECRSMLNFDGEASR